MVTIINYGLGNSASIKNMLKSIGVESEITSDIETISKSKKIILPGVGNFGAGMRNIISLGLLEVLNQKVLKEKTPLLGICLGMQLLTNASEEDESEKGLGWINAKTVKFTFEDKNIKIPHMGWADVLPAKNNVRLFEKIELNPRFYFVHSYHVTCADSNNEMAISIYGKQFVCAIMNENILGVQFHPEKSHKYGMQLLKNFVELY